MIKKTIFCLFVFASIASAGQFPRNYPGLVGLFHFNDGGLNYYMNSNNDLGNYTLGATNPLLTDARFSKGYMFLHTGVGDPDTNYTNFIYTNTTVPSAITGSNPRTFIFWLYLMQYAVGGDTRAIFGYGKNAVEANGPMFYVMIGDPTAHNTKLSIQTYATGQQYAVDDSTPLPLNQWVQCAITYSGTTIKFYRNGNYVNQTILSNALNTTQSELLIGAKYVGANVDHTGGLNQYSAKMILDELIILNYQASDNEIKKIYQEQVGNYSQCEQ